MFSEKKPLGYSSPLPTLDTKGWVTGLDIKTDYIFAYYLTSQKHQTLHHLPHVRSFQYTVAQHSNNPVAMCRAIEEDLKELFSDYIDLTEVVVSFKEHYNGVVDYTMDMTFVHRGYKWTKGRIAILDGPKVKEILELNRGEHFSI